MHFVKSSKFFSNYIVYVHADVVQKRVGLNAILCNFIRIPLGENGSHIFQ